MLFSEMKDQKLTKIVERIIRIVCFVSLPLILLFVLTILTSLLFSGAINVDVNAANSFGQVFVSFSLPMLTALVLIPLALKIFGEHKTLESLGYCAKPEKRSLLLCAALGLIVLGETYLLTSRQLLQVSAATICFHFFIVAVSEETILRSVIMDELQQLPLNRFFLCLVNAAIFAFIYHSADDFLANLLVRVPLGLVLSYARLKANDIYLPIMLHWAYNMGVTALA